MAESSNKSVDESLSALVDGENSELDLETVLNADSTTRDRWQRYHLIGSIIRKENESTVSVDISNRIRLALEDEALCEKGTNENRSYENEPDQAEHFANVIPIFGQYIKTRDAIGKVAIAASVAAAFIFGMQQIGIRGQAEGVSADIVKTESTGDETLQVATSENSLPHVDTTSSVSAAKRLEERALARVPAGFSTPQLNARTVSSGNLQQSDAFPTQFSNQTILYNTQELGDEELHSKINRLLLKHAEQSSATGSMGVMPFTRVSKVGGKSE